MKGPYFQQWAKDLSKVEGEQGIGKESGDREGARGSGGGRRPASGTPGRGAEWVCEFPTARGTSGLLGESPFPSVREGERELFIVGVSVDRPFRGRSTVPSVGFIPVSFQVFCPLLHPLLPEGPWGIISFNLSGGPTAPLLPSWTRAQATAPGIRGGHRDPRMLWSKSGRPGKWSQPASRCNMACRPLRKPFGAH